MNTHVKKSGCILVLSSPSGGGKTTLVRYMQKKHTGLKYSVSTTTRPARPGDRNGYDYYFVDRTVFRNMIKKKMFIEWALVHGNYYGTPVANISKAAKTGRSIILDLDVQGAKNVKKIFSEAVLVFITASSMKEYKRRLLSRGQDNKKVINERLMNAKKELKEIKHFDYLVINDDLRIAKKEISAIYEAACCRIRKR